MLMLAARSRRQTLLKRSFAPVHVALERVEKLCLNSEANAYRLVTPRYGCLAVIVQSGVWWQRHFSSSPNV